MIKFIDLFAGIGGFHEALNRIGDAECVFASEIDTEASSVYEANFGVHPSGDITDIAARDIPSFDLLCAGFPCQPFSKGGNQNGFNDVRGTLFFDIARIIDYHKPKFVLLENVPNIVSHDKGNTYKTILNTLKKLGYTVPDIPIILSPHDIGVPVHRPRAFIPCLRSDISSIEVNIEKNRMVYDPNYIMEYFSFYEGNIPELNISRYEEDVLTMWDEFYKGIDLRIIGFPVWYDVFKLKKINRSLPKWKQGFIDKNISLYARNTPFIKEWEKKYDNLKWVTSTHRKFEWQCGTDCKGIFDGLIQFRPSGVRVKRLNYFSTLVAMNHPQIIGPLKRRLHADETKLLQSFPDQFQLHSKRNVALKQLGNSVNVEVVRYVIEHLLEYERG